jgi:DNA modification methylase
MNNTVDIRIGDSVALLRAMPDESVQCCVTSPPYYGLRKYGDSPDEMGQEKTPEAYVERMAGLFDEVRRVLKSDGILWVNIGDSYAGSGKGGNPPDSIHQKQKTNRGSIAQSARDNAVTNVTRHTFHGIKAKDLIGIPWMLAFALRARGWYLRCDIVWAKANCMPESVTDRPTRSHEFIFLLSKSKTYFYDAEAIKEPCIWDVDGTGTQARKARAKEENKSYPTAEVNGMRNGGFKDAEKFNGKTSKLTGGAYNPPGQPPRGNARSEKQRGHSRRHQGFNDRWDLMEKQEQCTGTRNKRDVWTVAPANYAGAHFATFPPNLIRPCILAGTRIGDTVLDPFGGSGTVGQVALECARSAILLDLYDKHRILAEERCDVTPGLPL